MNQPISAPPTVNPAELVSNTRLHGPSLAMLRLGWFTIAIVVIALFALGLPVRYSLLSDAYSGTVAAQLKRNGHGEIVLSPARYGPLARAGVLEGDLLVAINGVAPASGVPLEDVFPLGPAGSTLRIAVRTGNGNTREYVVPRGSSASAALGRFGFSTTGMAAIGLAADILFALLPVAVAALIAWYRSDDWLALLVSLSLLLLAVGTALPVQALEQADPRWSAALDVWYSLVLIGVNAFFYLFPNGRFVPRWGRLVLGALLLWMLAARLWFGLYPWRISVFTPLLTYTALLGTGVLAQLYRYRRVSNATERRQTRLVVFGSAIAVIGVTLRLTWPTNDDASSAFYDLVVYPFGRLLEAALPISIGVAILRHRLWDIDLIIRRTLLYGALTASVIGAYALVVGTLGALFQTSGSFIVSLVGAGVVAVLFQPLRERIQRSISRLFYGQRDEPYLAVSRLGRRLEAALAPDMVLPAVVETVAQALKLPYAAIVRSEPSGDVVLAEYREADAQPLVALESFTLTDQGETVGRLLVAPREAGEELAPPDHALLKELARQAGAAVNAVRLTEELKRSRERLVLAREEERRRLRRDLHDGLGPALAAQTLKVGTARFLLANNPAAADELLESLERDINVALADIRRLVYNLRPPALDELGLEGALRATVAQYDATKQGCHFAICVPAALPVLPAAVEVAAFRIAQEALANVVRHADARHCTLHLVADGELTLIVEDDGKGITPGAPGGVGLVSMGERADELGGTVQTEPATTAGGTRITVRLPLRNAVE